MKSQVADGSKSIINKVTISCFLAGMTEMYDFVIFGLLVGLIKVQYLNHLEPSEASIVSYALFAAAFFFRPVGAFIFGRIGDIHGRKIALVTSISMIGLSSLALSLLPSYELMGVSTCYLIAAIRAIQGISVGGEFTGGMTYVIEHFDKSRSGFAGSFVLGGCLSGILTATIVANIVQLPSMPDYAWRFAFLLGFFMSLVGFFIRQKLAETPEFRKTKKSKHKIPLIVGLKKHRLEAITTVLIGATCGTNVFYVVVYLPNYLTKTLGLNLTYLSIISTFVMMVLTPFFGWVSDKMSRGKLIVIGAVLSAAYALVMLPLIMYSPTVLNICLAIAVHAAIFAIQDGTINVFAVEIFPTEYRYSCSAFCYSLGIGVLGGLTPTIATLIVENLPNPNLMLGLYVGTITMLTGIAVGLTTLKRNKLSVSKVVDKTCISKLRGAMVVEQTAI